MHWLMIVLFASMAALLAASAGVAHHIWRAHRQRDNELKQPADGETEIQDQTEEAQ